jgi:transcriptional antiterminator RfaH
MRRWYLVHTKPASERLAEAQLQRQGYEVYLPRALRTVRHRGRWLERIVALFPRYLFLRLNEGTQALNPVRCTRGVAGVVRFGSLYTVVPESVIDELRAHADPQSGLHRLMRATPLNKGAPVTVNGGPFSGLSGIFLRVAGADRVVVLLRLLGQEASVHVPIDAVVASS